MIVLKKRKNALEKPRQRLNNAFNLGYVIHKSYSNYNQYNISSLVCQLANCTNYKII